MTFLAASMFFLDAKIVIGMVDVAAIDIGTTSISGRGMIMSSIVIDIDIGNVVDSSDNSLVIVAANDTTRRGIVDSGSIHGNMVIIVAGNLDSGGGDSMVVADNDIIATDSADGKKRMRILRRRPRRLETALDVQNALQVARAIDNEGVTAGACYRYCCPTTAKGLGPLPIERFGMTITIGIGLGVKVDHHHPFPVRSRTDLIDGVAETVDSIVVVEGSGQTRRRRGGRQHVVVVVNVNAAGGSGGGRLDRMGWRLECYRKRRGLSIGSRQISFEFLSIKTRPPSKK